MGQRRVVMAKRYECEPCGYIYDPRIGDTAVLLREFPLKNCRKTGSAPSAEWEKNTFIRSIETRLKKSHGE